MTREHARQFSDEIERYRRSLVYFARVCEWEEFTSRAGRLFDYVESVEFRELERRFFRTFYAVLAPLAAGVLLLVLLDFPAAAELQRLRNALVLGALCVSSFELFFYFDYRTYREVRIRHAGQRREQFIRSLERDFRVAAHDGDVRQAA